MTITSEANASPHEGATSTIEIGCPNCGSRYRLAIADSDARERHFHCLSCDNHFATTLQSANRINVTPPEPSVTPASDSASAIFPNIVTTPITPQPVCAAAAPPLHAAPSVRLWPWLMALLLIVAGIGGWLNQQAWLHTPLVESVHAWWAPQRSIGWQISHPRPQWINRQDAPPLLAIGVELRNGVLFDRTPPPLLLTTHIRGDNRAAESQLVTLHQQPSLTQLEQPSWQPPSADRTPISAGVRRSYTIVLNHPPKLLKSVELTLN
ncbi:MAG: zinc ribbon domain-containing protein [Mariprofundales bacterium]